MRHLLLTALALGLPLAGCTCEGLKPEETGTASAASTATAAPARPTPPANARPLLMRPSARDMIAAARRNAAAQQEQQQQAGAAGQQPKDPFHNRALPPKRLLRLNPNRLQPVLPAGATTSAPGDGTATPAQPTPAPAPAPAATTPAPTP